MTDTNLDAAEDWAIKSWLLLASALLGTAVAYLVFVLFLQTAVVSPVRLLATLLLLGVVTLAHYWIGIKWLWSRLRDSSARRVIGTALLLVALFFPQLYRPPAYPLSPVLRPWTDLAVQFEVPSGAASLTLPADGVRLVMGKEALTTAAFQLVGPWQASGPVLMLAPGTTASLRWTGTIPEAILLAIEPPSSTATLTVYWDGTRTVNELRPGQQTPILITQKALLPWGFNLAFLLSWFIIPLWVLGLAGILVAGRIAMPHLADSQGPRWAVIVLSILLAILTVKLQVDSLGGGLKYLTSTQLARHFALLQGQAPDPWQYRVLSAVIAEGMVRLFGFLGPQAAVSAAFISLRLLQNVAIFLAAFALYKKVSASNWLALLGVLILTGSMINAYFDNDLSFNTYFDLLFYLLCVLLLLSRNYTSAVIVTLLAALNRETSGLIPFVMAGAIHGDSTRPGFRKYMPALLSLAVFIGVFVSLRFVFPPRPLYVPYRHEPGIPLLLYNLTRSFTWQQLFTTLGLVPLIGLVFFPSWPPLWQRLLLIVCPLWFVIHAFASVMAETRLFLVPQAIIFIPGALFAVSAWLSAKQSTAIPSLPYQPGAS